MSQNKLEIIIGNTYLVVRKSNSITFEVSTVREWLCLNTTNKAIKIAEICSTGTNEFWVLKNSITFDSSVNAWYQIIDEVK